MKLLAKALSLALISLPLLANAGARSATMQVSFTVTDACTVQSAADNANAAPTVACQLASPHLLSHGAPSAADSSTANSSANSSAASHTNNNSAGAQDWTLYF